MPIRRPDAGSHPLRDSDSWPRDVQKQVLISAADRKLHQAACHLRAPLTGLVAQMKHLMLLSGELAPREMMKFIGGRQRQVESVCPNVDLTERESHTAFVRLADSAWSQIRRGRHRRK